LTNDHVVVKALDASTLSSKPSFSDVLEGDSSLPLEVV
jgi:hypothetical protein